MRNISINDIIRKFDNRPPFFSETIDARFDSVNLSSTFTAMIKEAARCNYYSSDLFYDMQAINDKIENFNTNEDESYTPILVAMRKMGVDGNSFILSRVNDASARYEHAIIFPSEYFSIFIIEFHKDNEYSDLGYYKIEVRAYHI